MIHQVIRIKENEKVVYSATTLCSTVFPYAVIVTFEEASGYQRTLDMKKVSSIAKYLGQPFWSLPELTMVGIGDVEFVPYDTRFPDYGALHVEGVEVLDGQHRIYGAERRYRNSKHSQDVRLRMKIYHHLSHDEKIKVFCDLNENATKVPKSQIRLVKDKSYETLESVRLAKSNTSPLNGLIALDGKRNTKSGKLITLESFARAITEMYRSAKLAALHPKLRSDLIDNFFELVFLELNDRLTSEYRLLNSYGVSFLGVVGREYMQECLHDGELDDERLQQLIKLLRKWDWTKQSGATGAVSGARDAVIFLREVVFCVQNDHDELVV